jgi:hypothetical protein
MSWLSGVRGISSAYHAVRQAKEGFVKPYVQPTPQYLYFKTLYCYPLRGESYYYMSLDDYTRVLVASERETAKLEGWQQVEDAALRARRDGFVKDPPLVAAEIFPKGHAVAELLSTYPAAKMLLYAEIARKRKEYGWTWGHMKKTAIERALASRPLEWHELQAIKHPDALRDLLRMTHPKPPSEEVSAVWRWALGKGEAPTPKTRAYEEVRKLAAEGRHAEAVEKAVEAELPWEVVRSRVGLSGLPSSVVAKAAERLMTPNDVAMQARTLLDAGLDAGFVAQLVKRRNLALNAAARAAVGLLPSCREAAEAFFEKALLPRERFEALLPMKPKRVVALVDVSGSMFGPRLQSAARILMPFRQVFEKAYEFDEEVRPLSLDTLDDFDALTRKEGEGTRLYDSIITVARHERLGEEDLLFVVTDEQENYSRSSLQDVMALNTNVVEAVVAPYPADMILKAPVSRFVAYPGSDPDALIAAARLVAAGRVLESEKVVELSKLLPPAAAH